MKSTLEKWLGSRRGGRVERCHGIPHLGSYSNAAHQWGVAMLMWYIWPEHYHRLSIYCLTHDLPEAWVGDIPSPTLRYCPEVREAISPLETLISAALGTPPEHELTGDDLAMLKACDRLELFAWGQEQRLLGNVGLEGMMMEIEHYLDTSGMPAAAWEFYQEMKLARLVERDGLMLERIT